MQQKATPWLIALTLSMISLAILLLPTTSHLKGPVLPTEDSIELASIGQAEVVSVWAEIVEDERRGAEMVVFSTIPTDLPEDTPHQMTMDLPDGQAVTVQGADLALGKRFWVSQKTADHVRDPGSPDVDGLRPRVDQYRAFTIDSQVDAAGHLQRIDLADMDSGEIPVDASQTGSGEDGDDEDGAGETGAGEDGDDETGDDELPSSPPSLVLTLTAGSYGFAEQGGWEVPIYVVVRRRLEGGELAATTVPEAMSILVEAPATEPRRVTIEADRARSTEAVYVPLRRSHELEVTATDLIGNATPASLTLSWRNHGPKALKLKVSPPEANGYATPLSPIHLFAHVELDEQRLLPGRDLPMLASASEKLTVEPTDASLGAGGLPIALTVLSHQDGEETLTLQMPDLDLETQVTVRFRRPYLFLGLAALFGVLGVIAARRRQLFEQRKGALTLELLAAAIGGALLYAAFLMQWLPTPGFLVAALPASAVGVVGGYAGDGVFQVLLKVMGLAK